VETNEKEEEREREKERNNNGKREGARRRGKYVANNCAS